MNKARRTACLAGLLLLCISSHAEAYVGPGAGIAFVTTAATLLTSAIISLFVLLLWPFRQVYLLLTQKKPPKTPKIDRAIIIGLDGLDPDLVKRFMVEGALPNLTKLAARGSFRKLATTFPSMSPVAWSTFATGVNPGKHGIYDFLTRDPRTYLPDLSSAEVGPPDKFITLGKYKIPIGQPRLKLLRKSVPFWKILDKYRVPSAILRVPITFPADQFDGMMLSAMCVPDLQGTQGSYTYFTSEGGGEQGTGGRSLAVQLKDGRASGSVEGPENPLLANGKKLLAPFTVDFPKDKPPQLTIGDKAYDLPLNKYTEWVPIDFKAGLGITIGGIGRFRLLEQGNTFRMYLSPINIDPAKPVLPISHPKFFSIFLAKLIGRFSTLGLAEDTWALNEGVLDEQAFLEQVDAIHSERERMFFEMLKRQTRGVLACVFDSTDRVQHMFMRHLDGAGGEASKPWANVIRDIYAKCDEMVGRALKEINVDDPRTLVVVMSDHGFKTFKRGVNLNSWLLKNGYMTLKEGKTKSGDWFEAVDWTKTKAFALGLGGIFLNVKGREAQGTVAPGDVRALCDELTAKIKGLVDENANEVCIQEVYPAYSTFKGPYTDKAPDLIIGYCAGWRASWEGVQGVVNDVVFDVNTKAWAGDHCIDPKLVPGVFISSQPIAKDGDEPSIADMAPTILDLFGVPAPKHMDGHSLLPAGT